MNELFLSTASQKILDFLSSHPHESFYSAQIAGQSSLSKGGTNQILRALASQGILKTEKKGRMIFYRVDAKSALIKQFKVLKNVSFAQELIKKIKPVSERIVLFGSGAIGEDTKESDMDLFVVALDKTRVRSLIPEFKNKRKIQILVKTPQEYVALENKEPIFYEELRRGVVLWEKE